MSQILDANGNAWLGSRDQVTNQTETDTRTVSASLSALNAEAIIDLNGKACCMVDLRAAGACTLTVVFEGSVDGTNYFGLPALTLQDPALALLGPENYVMLKLYAAATPNQLYVIGTTGYRRFRVRVSAYTSGTIVVTLRATIADYVITNRQIPATLGSTVTAAANAGATLTLVAPPAGLYIYVTHIDITRNATAALAGTATLVITSTNLPSSGGLTWSVGNAMIAGGTQRDVDIDFGVPLKASNAGTAATIVMPVPGAAVLWRANATYYYAA